ncbi:SAM-dependent DNA methyltransferase [Pseudomonas aeruginosa]|uniref:class I SAM-dependent DNA methyltransferase n=1 Tax=Pseudomonas aeruginosa TaxID=287 RepID=UPI00053CF253|nr:class I SAM-dependent DNA methyltransferase [Pseudomonas aeruginosa]ALZ06984.1 restriction endonuclease HindVIIP subunit M [Pseudomonas aeruginosa]EIU1689437.1 SAM-dependent DNA methyltransferase [Pseudomonas aeruginosa]EIU7208018.1 SAM-dependent DNA methyltransferase [Pseudomonas aeruginosa]EIU7214502.1 SAM-dependent DNA methyltransferase [Pseudomonas aeruginosa]EKV4826560.1 SAM-dependent DNA methyltransferase [Pseudomonas aeruginosa]
MAGNDATESDYIYADTLWKSADTLRGQIDAAEYKHVVLGLLFLKYISDSFSARRDELKTELEADGITGAQCEALLENRDEYTAERVFWVPPEARWANLQDQAARPDIATLIDDAILAVERDNPNLKGKLPRDYARRGIEPVKLKGLIDLIADIGFKGDRAKARDTLGRVYEYFLGKFAQAEGKLGGEFYTPRSVVRVLVEMLEPYQGRVYDPACGSGGMFVQSERFVEAHGGQKTDLSIFGQESNPTTWRLAHMNLAIRSIEANLGSQPGDSFLRDLHPDLKADYILANPPFNISDWSGELLQDDVRWRYGTPPLGNANYAWIQHFIHHLAVPNGRGGGVAGFVMANGSLSSNSGGEGDIRQRIVEADLVDCIVALPAQLFFTTGIPVCLWFLTRDKTGRNLKNGCPNRPDGRRGETLFIDARKLGTMQTRTLRVLKGCEDGDTLLPDGMGDPKPDTDIGRIVYAFRKWRGEPKPEWWDEATHGEWLYRDTPGFCKAANIEEIRRHGFALTPGRYVGAEEQEEDGEPFEDKYPRLLAEVEQCFRESERLTLAVRKLLGEISL